MLVRGLDGEEVEILTAPKRNVIFDATLLSSVMSCARLVDLRYHRTLVPIKGGSTSLEMGSCVHKILEEYYVHVVNGFPRNVAITAGMTAGALFARGCEGCSGFKPSPEIPTPICKHKVDEYPGFSVATDEDKELVFKTMDQYFEFWKNDSWTPLFVERVVGKVLYEDDELRILWKAKVDVGVDTNQGIFPVDHKTMKQRRDTLSLNNQFIGQCLVMETRQTWINKIGFQTTLKPQEKFLRVPMSYSADRLIEWSSEILPYWAKMYLMFQEGGYYPPNFTHCENKFGVCAFKDVCEANTNMREEELRINFKIGNKWDPTND